MYPGEARFRLAAARAELGIAGRPSGAASAPRLGVSWCQIPRGERDDGLMAAAARTVSRFRAGTVPLGVHAKRALVRRHLDEALGHDLDRPDKFAGEHDRRRRDHFAVATRHPALRGRRVTDQLPDRPSSVRHP